jgi:hypothetical protein
MSVEKLTLTHCTRESIQKPVLVGDLIEFAADDFEHEVVWQKVALCDDARSLSADG